MKGKTMGLIESVLSMLGMSKKDAPHGYWPIEIDTSYGTQKFTRAKDYLSASQLISWVSVCCSKIGERVAMTPWGIYDTDNEPTKNKDLIKLFTRPNPYQTAFSFREALVWHLLLAGNAYIWKTEATNIS